MMSNEVSFDKICDSCRVIIAQSLCPGTPNNRCINRSLPITECIKCWEGATKPIDKRVLCKLCKERLTNV